MCTTHWNFADRFVQRYPHARFLRDRLFVKEDGIYTSAGVASGLDLALYLVQELWGPHFAARVAKDVVIYFRRAPGDPQLNIYTQYRNHLDHRVHTVQDMLLQSLETKLTIEALAASVNMSPRNLTRLFRKTTNISIGEYLERIRAERALQLIGEGLTKQAAALQCGLKSTNQLRSLLKRHAAS
jgi:transcriptional regulator GlxA family with amidase domain